MRKILITNDDGPYSPGLWLLYEAVRDFGEIIIMVPETPKSASGLGITLHKPLRINKVKIYGKTVYITNGTPSDIVYLASKAINEELDLVLSGVNIGDNTSMQVILSSGTVGAAAQAALEGIPAIAFSAAVRSTEDFENDKLRSFMKNNIRKLVKGVLLEKLPEGVDMLNVNFPSEPCEEYEIVPTARLRYASIVDKRVDPRGIEYYWVYGEPLGPEKDTDVYTVHVEKKIAITPLSIVFKVNISKSVINHLKRYFNTSFQ
ncbi:MAG TPA: 5'/3'-nucleotidase SurE [Thermofilum sp.]|nr:5'/3'-nucleotidase SurE [Thermofilum sp.]